MIVIALLIAVFVPLCGFFVYWKLTYWQRQGIPNEIGSIFNRFVEPFHLADQNSQRKYGDVVGIYEGLRPSLMVTDPVMVKKVLIEEFHNFPNHRIFYHKDQLAGKNIVVLEDNEWKRLRTIITPVFTSSKLRAMRPLFEECVQTLIANISDACQSSSTVDIKLMFGSYSLDVIASTAFGTKLDSARNPDNEVVRNMRSFFGKNISIKSLIVLFFPSLMRFFDIYLFDYNVLVFLSNLTHKILDEREDKMKSMIKGCDGTRRDLIQLLYEAKHESGDKLSRQEIADQVILFMVAGYDTSSTALCSIAYCLALNQNVQEKLRTELRAFVATNPNGLEDYEALGRLEYLDAVIKESLRVLPSVPRIERRSNKVCTLGNVRIPKDSMIIIPIYTLNRDPRYFDMPQQFIPERWLKGNEFSIKATNVLSSVYVPFAAGPRSCIGARYAYIEMKACIANVILKFKLDRCDQTQIPLEYFTGQPVSTAREVKLNVKCI